jgi:hypothetical protein
LGLVLDPERRTTVRPAVTVREGEVVGACSIRNATSPRTTAASMSVRTRGPVRRIETVVEVGQDAVRWVWVLARSGHGRNQQQNGSDLSAHQNSYNKASGSPVSTRPNAPVVERRASARRYGAGRRRLASGGGNRREPLELPRSTSGQNHDSLDRPLKQLAAGTRKSGPASAQLSTRGP